MTIRHGLCLQPCSGDLVEEAFIAFGSNLGNSVGICLDAVESIGHHPDIDILKVSSFYLSRPVGSVEPPWFVNGVLQCLTALAAWDLLQLLMRVQNQFGRTRGVRWSQRTLDLDLLFLGGKVISSPNLTLPHPRLHERTFVLTPLSEIAPGCVHPCYNLTERQMLERLGEVIHEQKVVRLEIS